MEEKKNPELTVEKKDKKKSEWGVKKVITTIIIAILALLMIGGLYYIVILIQQDTDDSNVFGVYDGKPIRYEAGSVFYNSVNTNEAYKAAVESGDFQGLYSSWYQGYQAQVVFNAFTQKAEKAKISIPEKLVDKALVNSGIYASEDGSKTFDEEVYNNVSAIDRTATYQYYTKLMPYLTVLQDYQTVKTSEAEKTFISNLVKDTKSFDYYVINYNAYPTYLAYDYDISEMEVEEGTEPTAEQIKAYIYSKEADTVKPYIEEALAKAVAEDFYSAAEDYGNGLVKVENVSNNIGGSSFIYNSIENTDSTGALASVMTEDLAKELFNAKAGYETQPIATSDGYIVVKVVEKEADENNFASSYVAAVYDYYMPSAAVNAIAAQVMASDKHEDNFMNKFFPMVLGSFGQK